MNFEEYVYESLQSSEEKRPPRETLRKEVFSLDFLYKNDTFKF